MFVELVRKDNGQPLALDTSNVDVFNPDADGIGTMIIMKSGVVRTVTESYQVIKAAMGFSSFGQMALDKAKKKSKA